VELLPRSEDAAIKVALLSPSEEALARGDVGGGTGEEGQLKPGATMRNKITNNVVFSRTVKAGEKFDVPFSYSVEWPHQRKIEIV
jgi:hypothetical protein